MASLQGTIVESLRTLLIADSKQYIQKETNRILDEINTKYPNQYATFSNQQYFFKADNPPGFKNYRCDNPSQEWFDDIQALTNIQKQTIDDNATLGFVLFDLVKTAPSIEDFLSIVPKHLFEGETGKKLNILMNQMGKDHYRGMNPLAVIKKYIGQYDPLRTQANWQHFLTKRQLSIETLQAYTVQHIVVR